MRNGGCLGLGWEGEVVAVNAQSWVARSGRRLVVQKFIGSSLTRFLPA